MIILVTGSTDGIGKQTALELAREGHQVFIHGRDESRVKNAITELSEESGNAHLKGIVADLGSLDAVGRLAATIGSETDTLDILINNAGVLSKRFVLSHDGLELTFAINHLAHFYLTNRLLPLIRNSQNGRIINVSSDVHSKERNIQFEKDHNRYDGVREYGVSKLCNILFTYKLARDLKNEGITCNCLHPGVINTKMLIETWGAIGNSLEKGAETSVYLALSEKVAHITGKYFKNKREVKSAPISYNIEVQEELWRVSEEIIYSIIGKRN
jgi:NAD(P)-dependent dehydrogenase (short-subunit alcohol dehydrogenase family)